MVKIYGRWNPTGEPVLLAPVHGNGDKFKRVYGCQFDKDSGLVFFPCFFPFLPDVYNDLVTVFPDLELTDGARQLIRTEKARYKLFQEERYEKPYKPVVSLYAHQQKSLLRAIYYYRTGLLLSPGLGKTAVAINLLRYLREPALVLVPPMLIENWRGEIEKHSEKGDFKVESLDGSVADKKKLLEGKINADVLLVGYETAARYQEEIFKAFDYKVLVADESQRIKGLSSSRTKAALFLASKTYRRILMSGTAVLGSPADLYPQLKLLCEPLVGPWWPFRAKYMTFAKHNKHICTGFRNLNQLNERVNSIAIRITKEQALDLPERLIIDRKFDLSGEQKEMIKELLSDETLYLPEGQVSKLHKIVAIQKVAQVSGGFLRISQKDPFICDSCTQMELCVEGKIKPYTKECAVVQREPEVKVREFKENPKLDHMKQLVDEITADPTNKILIWAHYKWELAAICKALAEMEVKYEALPDDAGDVIESVNRFENDQECKALVGQVSRGVGFTANSANFQIFYSMDWSLGSYLQAIDRCHRIGQKRSVTVYRLVANNSLDPHIVAAIDAKADVAETLLGKVECLRCPKSLSCLVTGIKPWDPGCVLKSVTHKKRFAL